MLTGKLITTTKSVGLNSTAGTTGRIGMVRRSAKTTDATFAIAAALTSTPTEGRERCTAAPEQGTTAPEGVAQTVAGPTVTPAVPNTAALQASGKREDWWQATNK